MKKLNAYELMGMMKAKQIQKQKGASMIEYALVVAVVVAIGAAFFTGTDSGVGKLVSDKLTAAGATAAAAP